MRDGGVTNREAWLGERGGADGGRGYWEAWPGA